MPSYRWMPRPDLKNFRPYLSLLLGIGFGLFVYSYWLLDFLPPTSKQIILYTVLLGLGGAVGYFLLLESWIIPQWSETTTLRRWTLILSSVVAGAILLFGGTDAWRSSSRYITFLLPQERLEISVPTGQSVPGPEIILQRFTTSFGDVSYNELDYSGWKRVGYQLVLQDPSKNKLEWTGRAGEEAAILFLRPPQGGTIDVAWNGMSQTINLASKGGELYTYTQNFKVPFYASRDMVNLLGVVNFTLICLAVNLLIFKKRTDILTGLERSISITSPALHHGTNKDDHGNADQRKTLGRDWAVIFGILILALLLRAFNLENLYPYIDEYNHLLAAKAIVSGAPLNSVYPRSLIIVTLPVAFFFRLFGTQLWSARLAGVLFNALAIIPLYLLTKKINKPVGVLSCVLYATSPWVISISRYVREYAYFPFYFYWIAYGMVLFIERFPERFILFKEWRTAFQPGLRYLWLALFLPVIYSIIDVLFIQPSSTFKVILVTYGVFGWFILRKLDLKDKSNIKLLVGAAMGIVIGGYLVYIAGQKDVSLLPQFNGTYLNYFFGNPEQQWYFDRPKILWILAMASAIPFCLVSYRSNFVPSFLAMTFVLLMAAFLFFFRRFAAIRYVFCIQIWYVALVAIGLYGVWVILRILFPWKLLPRLLLGLTLVIPAVNFHQTLLPTLYAKQGYMSLTGEIHYDVGTVNAYLQDKVKPDDILISTVYDFYVTFKGEPVFKKTYHYDYLVDNPRESILAIINQYDSGWVVLDASRYVVSRTEPLPLGSLTTNDKSIDYIGSFADEYVWKWTKSDATP
jgi:hypothetical protein